MNVGDPKTPRSAEAKVVPSVGGLSALRVSRYDQVAALLVALLIIVGALVAMMYIVWLTGRVFVAQAPVTPRLVELAGDGGRALGDSTEMAEMGAEEIDELLEPQLTETVNAVTDLVTDQWATEESLGDESAATSRGGEGGTSRNSGTGGDTTVVPRWERWQIMFSANNLVTYARQLDYFGIELAAVGGSAQVDYAFRLTGNPPQRRSGSPRDERRMYMTWRYGSLREADLAILKRAGIDTENRIIMQFIPRRVEDQLAQIEQRYLQQHGRSLAEIEKTIFRVVGAHEKYQFEVQEVRARSARLR